MSWSHSAVPADEIIENYSTSRDLIVASRQSHVRYLETVLCVPGIFASENSRNQREDLPCARTRDTARFGAYLEMADHKSDEILKSRA